MPDEAPEKSGDEPFLSRWSRRKEEARQAPPPEARAMDAQSPPPELPPVESLTSDSDYRPFFHPKVDEDVRRAALRKMFSDPRFNVMDGLDVYIDDYSKTEPIPPAMMAAMKTAQDILRWAKEDREFIERREAERAAGQKALERPAAPAQEAAATVPEPVPASPKAPSTDA